MVLVLGAIWGGSFVFIAIAVVEIAPLALVLLRASIAAFALHVYLALRGPSFRVALPYAKQFFVLALFNNVVPFSLIFAGQTEIGAGLASVLNATTPFWTLIVANRLTSDEKLSPAKLIGIGLGVAGTAVMIGPGLVGDLAGPLWPKLAILGASISYAIGLILGKRLKGVPPAIIATGQLTASTIWILPVVILVPGPTGMFGASPQAWLAVLALALLATAFAYLLYFRLLASAGATNASLVTLVVPVSAILLGILFLGEKLELFEIGGMVLIAIGLLAMDGRLFRRSPQTIF